jgi:hypothetical protein
MGNEVHKCSKMRSRAQEMGIRRERDMEEWQALSKRVGEETI